MSASLEVEVITASETSARNLVSPTLTITVPAFWPFSWAPWFTPSAARILAPQNCLPTPCFSTRTILSSLTGGTCSTLVSSFGDSASTPMKQVPTVEPVSWLSADALPQVRSNWSYRAAEPARERQISSWDYLNPLAGELMAPDLGASAPTCAAFISRT